MRNLPRLIAAAVLASATMGVMAQAPAGPGAPGRDRAEKHARHGDPAEMQQRRAERMEARLAALRQKLALSPPQESAFASWATAMQQGRPMQRPDREAIAALTTPERIDRMRTLRTQRMAEMDRRGEATKTFYAALNTDQKRVFDAETARGKHGMHGRHHGGHGRG